MKDWMYASNQEIENMTLEEAKELIGKHITLGHSTGNFRPRQHMTKAFEIAKNAIEKQISMKPIYSVYGDRGDGKIIPFKAKCPTCEHEFEFGYWNNEDNHHCICGQKMNWSV